MNLNRRIIVPITAVVMFGVGYLIATGIGLAWAGMPLWLRWAIPVLLMLWYLFDAMQRERGR